MPLRLTTDQARALGVAVPSAPRRTGVRGQRVNLADTLYAQIQLAGLPLPEREYRFHPIRRWRADLAYVAERLAIECDGGIHTKGRHTRGVGFEADCDKTNQLAVLNWRVLKFTSAMIRRQRAVAIIQQALAQR